MAGWLEKALQVVAPVGEGGVGTLLLRLRALPPGHDDLKRTIKLLKTHALSPDSHEELGKAMGEFIRVLKTDKDPELVCETLELLNSIMRCSTDHADASNYVQLYNTELFVQEQEYLQTLLNLVEERESYIRLHSVYLMTTLLANKGYQLQEYILRSPMGIPRLMDLLSDGRESVRNAGLLLLTELSQSNQEIQKIIAFEGAFDILFHIIDQEGAADGGIVVHDCLHLLNVLIKGNVSNQNYFRETGCIQRLPNLLQLEGSDMWLLTDNKRQVLLLVLDTISLLVSANNPNTHDNQTVINKVKILELVMFLALHRVISQPVRIKALRTLAEIIQGHVENRNSFASKFIELDDADPQPMPVLDRLLSIVFGTQDIEERLQALYVFRSFLDRNEEVQMAIASTLTPLPAGSQEKANGALGRRLIQYLFDYGSSSNDSYRSWFAASILSYVIRDNPHCKELVLRIPLEIPYADGPLITLLAKTVDALMDVLKSNVPAALTAMGLLRFLSIWLYGSAPAVRAFLSCPGVLPFLVDTVNQQTKPHLVHIQGLGALLIGLCFMFNDDSPETPSSRAALLNIITNQITIDKFNGRLDGLRKTESFIFAEQDKPVVFNKDENAAPEKLQAKLYYDYDFTVFIKDSYGEIIRQIRSPYQGLLSNRSRVEPKLGGDGHPWDRADLNHAAPHNASKAQSEQEVILHSYKELIRNQDIQMDGLKKQIIELQHRLSQGYANTEGQDYRRIMDLEAAVAARDSEIARLQSTAGHASAPLTQPSEDFIALSRAYNDLEEILAAKDNDIAALRHQLQHPTGQAGSIVTSAPDEHSSAAIFHWQSKAEEFEAYNAYLQEQLAIQRKHSEELAALLQQEKNRTVPDKEPQGSDHQAEVVALREELKEIKDKYDSLEEQQEELLVCLAQIEIENNNLKEQLSSKPP